MRKLIIVLFALLLTVGVANATNIPQMVDPKNYPTVWTELVYNGSGSDIATGMCVIWDFDTSASDASSVYDDTGMWVKTCDDESSPWTAGVTTIGKSPGSDYAIPNGEVGRIIIRGPAVVHRAVEATAVTVNTFVSAGATGYVEDEVAGSDEAILGVVIKASAANNDIEDGIGGKSSLIWIDPTLCDQ